MGQWTINCETNLKLLEEKLGHYQFEPTNQYLIKVPKVSNPTYKTSSTSIIFHDPYIKLRSDVAAYLSYLVLFNIFVKSIY